MKKKLNKIAAVILSMAMILTTGFAAVPEVKAESAEAPSFTVKTSTTQMKPGDTVHVEFWLNEGPNVMEVIGGFDFDTSVYTYVAESLKTNVTLVSEIVNGGGQFIVESSDVDTAGGFSVLVASMKKAFHGPLKIFEFDVTVKDNASGQGLMGFVCEGAQVGDDYESMQEVPVEDVTSVTTDGNGNVIEDGKIPVYIELKSIEINKDDFTMAKGVKDTLTVKGTPEEAMVGKTVKWESSNKDVVTVDKEGNIEAVGIGEAVIKATVEGKSDSVKIHVNAPLKGIALNKSELTLKKGTSETLSVIYNPEDTTDDKKVTWKSSDKSVATVDKNGKVTALKDGTTTITATVGKFSAKCELTVQEVKLTGIELDNTELSLAKGESSKALHVIYNPENTTDDKTVTWTSADEKIATVKDGVVTAKSVGNTTITATVGKHTATCNVAVTSKLTSIEITPDRDTKNLEVGDKVNMEVTYAPADTTDVREVVWESMDTNIATVDENGVVTAVAGGTTKIAATSKADSSIKAECDIKVLIHTTGISLNKENAELLKGETDKLTVTFAPVNTDDGKEVKWTSDNEAVATVDAEGNVKAIKEGTTVITAEAVDGGHQAACVVTVKEIHVTDAQLDAELNPGELFKGQAHEIKVTVTPEETTDEVTYRYTSSDSEVAVVDENGVVHALKEGKADITVVVMAGNFTKELVYQVEVKEIPLEKIAIKEKITPIEVGKTAQLEVIYNPQNTTDAKDVVWSSSDTSVATVKNGLITAVKAGKTTITAKVGDKVDSYELTVTAKKENTTNNQNGKDEKPANGGAVQTGDKSPMFGLMFVMLLSVVAIAGTVVFKRKRMHR